MPHLSPLNWILSPILFWSLLLSFSSYLWWTQLPSAPQFSFGSPPSPNWSW